MIAMSTIKSPWTLLLCTFCSTIEWDVKPQKLNINSGIRFCHSIHLIHHFSVCLTHLHYVVFETFTCILWHKYKPAFRNSSALFHFSMVQICWSFYSTYQIIFSSVFTSFSSNESAMPYESCKDKHKIKFSIKLSSAVRVIYAYGHADVLDLVPSVLLDFIQLKTNCG